MLISVIDISILLTRFPFQYEMWRTLTYILDALLNAQKQYCNDVNMSHTRMYINSVYVIPNYPKVSLAVCLHCFVIGSSVFLTHKRL